MRSSQRWSRENVCTIWLARFGTRRTNVLRDFAECTYTPARSGVRTTRANGGRVGWGTREGRTRVYTCSAIMNEVRDGAGV